jgi:hypothetical protein
MLLFLVTADREDIACSVAYMISTTNSYLQATTVMFSTTPVDLKQAAKTN